MSLTIAQRGDLHKLIQAHLKEIESDLDYRRNAQATEIKAQLLQAKSTALLAQIELLKD